MKSFQFSERVTSWEKRVFELLENIIFNVQRYHPIIREWENIYACFTQVDRKLYEPKFQRRNKEAKEKVYLNL